MNDTILLLAQAILTSCNAAWMVAGALNNWVKPRLNYVGVRAVMRFEGMDVDYPEDYAQVAHRRIDNPVLHKIAFGSIVASETISALTLTTGAVLLWIALLGGGDPTLGATIAMLGALAFVINWTGFLIGGEYFCYWYTYFNAQATHLLLLVWGVLTLIFLAMTA